MARTNPLTFLQQVRSETAKVTWPSRREVGVSTVMVLVLTSLTAVFFFLVDFLIRSGLGAVLDLVG
ncbi:preprotein translocase subunit SecE [Pararhodobacter sp.]|uniref:preprotein translocase subunit SecE n=1 Tax=Pararhodobacter sp. TaxID=2127056 RepID=UPI002AFEE530|nr:preprotein translocase subunit SecE [Pararhodobacter sp.]